MYRPKPTQCPSGEKNGHETPQVAPSMGSTYDAVQAAPHQPRPISFARHIHQPLTVRRHGERWLGNEIARWLERKVLRQVDGVAAPRSRLNVRCRGQV